MSDLNDLDALIYAAADHHVATIPVNRPAAMNSFNKRMVEEFARVWLQMRNTDDVHAVVLRAPG